MVRPQVAQALAYAGDIVQAVPIQPWAGLASAGLAALASTLAGLAAWKSRAAATSSASNTATLAAQNIVAAATLLAAQKATLVPPGSNAGQ